MISGITLRISQHCRRRISPGGIPGLLLWVFALGIIAGGPVTARIRYSDHARQGRTAGDRRVQPGIVPPAAAESRDAEEFKLNIGAAATDDKEVAVLTRSTTHLMQMMAAQVEVPAKDLAGYRSSPGWESVPEAQGDVRKIEIHNSDGKPSDAFVSVQYRVHWFWIDDRDLKSKRVFAFMMMLFTLADAGQMEPLPLITIRAQ